MDGPLGTVRAARRKIEQELGVPQAEVRQNPLPSPGVLAGRSG